MENAALGSLKTPKSLHELPGFHSDPLSARIQGLEGSSASTSATRFTRALGDSRAARSTVPRVIVFAPVKQTVLKKQQQYRDRSKIIVGFGSTLDFVLTHSASCTGIRARSKLLLGRVRPPRPVPVHNNEIPSRLLDQHWMSTRFYGMPVAYR